MIKPSYSLTIPHPLARLLPILTLHYIKVVFSKIHPSLIFNFFHRMYLKESVFRSNFGSLKNKMSFIYFSKEAFLRYLQKTFLAAFFQLLLDILKTVDLTNIVYRSV